MTMKEIGEAFFLVAFRYNNNKGLSRAFYVSTMFPIVHARVNGEVYFPFPWSFWAGLLQFKKIPGIKKFLSANEKPEWLQMGNEWTYGNSDSGVRGVSLLISYALRLDSWRSVFVCRYSFYFFGKLCHSSPLHKPSSICCGLSMAFVGTGFRPGSRGPFVSAKRPKTISAQISHMKSSWRNRRADQLAALRQGPPFGLNVTTLGRSAGGIFSLCLPTIVFLPFDQKDTKILVSGCREKRGRSSSSLLYVVGLWDQALNNNYFIYCQLGFPT